ncbi:hypothetical protein ACFE04_029063 [Oxalis oulophora]
MELEQVHRYVLLNSGEVTNYINDHKKEIRKKHRGQRKFNIEEAHCTEFTKWFRDTVDRISEEIQEEVTWARNIEGFEVPRDLVESDEEEEDLFEHGSEDIF